jgi:hypothetical protein
MNIKNVEIVLSNSILKIQLRIKDKFVSKKNVGKKYFILKEVLG